MPYEGPNDPNLPKDIQERPAKERRAFVGAFNSRLEACEEEGGDDCESSAHAVGRAAANQVKESKMADEAVTKQDLDSDKALHEEETYKDRLDAARQHLMAMHPSGDTWVADMTDEYAIVSLMDNYYIAPHTQTEDGSFEFAEPMTWKRVRQRVVWEDAVEEAKARERARVEFDVDAPCGHKAIKLLGKANDGLRIGAYATVWGEVDCDGEAMTKDAVAPYVGNGAAPQMFWLHGMDKRFGARPVGTWDASSFRMDDTGLWVEGTVSDPDAIKQLEGAGAFGLSVGSVWYLIKRRTGNGKKEIIDWPLLEISVMEGGKQCVPSAHRQLADKALFGALAEVAAKAGLELVDPDEVDKRALQEKARRVLAVL